MTLLVAPVEHAATVFACRHWHYSRCVPAGKLIEHGVWESDRFVGVVVYGRGANKNTAIGLGMRQTELCELVRIALDEHEAPVTQIVAESLRLLRQHNPGLRLVLSYADAEQGHVGRIYQAGNWVYLGRSMPAQEYVVNGRRYHGRSLRARANAAPDRHLYGKAIDWVRATLDPDALVEYGSSKHRYALGLDRQMRRLLAEQSVPYPADVADGPLVRSVALRSEPHADEGSTVSRPDTVGEV